MASKIIFSADTAQFTGSVKVSVQEIRTMQQELKKAEQTAKQTFQEFKVQAQAGVISTDQLTQAEERYGRELLSIARTRGQLTEQFRSSGTKEIASEEAKRRAVEQTNVALRQQRVEAASIPSVSSEHFEPSARQKSAALVRGGGLRAAESFAATIPGFADLASVAFPVVGAIALASEVAKGVGEFIKLREEANHAGEAIRQAFDESHAKAQVTVDDLTIQGDKLQDNIDKLSGHPNNGLRTALDEARAYADKLLVSLQADRKELAALLKEHSIGTFGSLLSGVAATGKQEKEILADQSSLDGKVESANADFNKAAAKAGSLEEIKQLGKKRDEAVRVSIQSTIDTYRKEAKRLYDEQTDNEAARLAETQYASSQGRGGGGALLKPIDNSAKIANVEGVVSRLQGRLAVSAASSRVIDLTEKEGAAKQSKELGKQDGEAARKALEEQRKAQEAQREQWATEFSEWSAATNRSAAEISFYWLRKEAETTQGSKNFQEAVQKSNAAIREMNRETAKLDKENTHILEEMQLATDKRVNKEDAEGQDKIGGRGLAFVLALQGQVKAQQQGNDALAEAQIQRAVETGQLSKTAAAYQLATIHAQQYARATDALNQKREGVGDNDPDRDQKLKLIDTEQTKLDASNAVTVFQDSARLAATSWRDSLKNANALFVQDSQDSAKQVAEIYGSVLGGLNSDLAKAFSEVGERGHHIGRELGNAVGGTLRGVGGQVADIGLRRLESTAFSALGLGGKPDGSPGNPMHVFVTNLGSKNPADAAISSLVSRSEIGGDANQFATSALSFLPGGSLLSGIFGGARAMGGGVDAGKTFLVGEHGPELFSPSATGYITPNNRISSGGDTHHWTVDARGAHDPAAVEAAVNRGIAKAAPSLIAASAQHQRDQRLRSPRNSG